MILFAHPGTSLFYDLSRSWITSDFFLPLILYTAGLISYEQRKDHTSAVFLVLFI